MTKADEIVDKYGPQALDLVLTVYVNFYYSELDIMNLCSRWVPRREILQEKSFLIRHMADEVSHAKLFREGVERLGIDWDTLDHKKYRLEDINDRFTKLHRSDDELEVLIGLNLYAEGILALEEIQQLGEHKPEYFYKFDQIFNDEKRHVAFGITVANRLMQVSDSARQKAQEHCAWYWNHLNHYLSDDLAAKIELASSCGFVSADYIDRTKARFHDVMGKLEIAC